MQIILGYNHDTKIMNLLYDLFKNHCKIKKNNIIIIVVNSMQNSVRNW